MSKIIKIEELAMFILSIHFFHQLPFEWWWFPALLLAPDISMLGYLINSKVGAYSYNLFHHKAIAIIVWMIGVYFQNNQLLFAGIILFAHSSMDRVFGYGLKYLNSFHNTHLGIIGQLKSKQ